MMQTRRHTAGLALISLTLLLAACGGGTVAPPLVGTPITSLADSGTGSLRDLLSTAKDGDTLKLASGTITLAGPLKVTRNVTLDLGSGVIDAAGTGRALEIPSGVTVTIQGGTLRGGTGAPLAVQGLGSQAVNVATYGGVLLNEGTLTLDGTAVTGGKANVGGGIANLKTGTLTLKGTSSVTSNTAQALPADATEDSGEGGGVFNSGVLQVEGGKVSSNTAVSAGGGIYNLIGGTVTIRDGGVDNNSCTYPLTVTNGGTNGCAGGGIFSFGNVTLTGGTISGNTATYFGGGVAMVREFANEVRQVLTVSGGTIENNKTTGNTNTGGGGIWSSEIVAISGGSIKGNSSMYGGGIDNWGTLTVSGGTFEGNAATESGGAIISTRKGLTTMTGGTIKGNTAKTGGGVAVSEDTTFVLKDGVISGNTATDGSGGLRNWRGTIDMQGGTVSGNTGKDGAGILIEERGTLKLSGGTIENNTATGYGGGIRLYDSASLFEMTSGAVRGNSAGQCGGGIHSDIGLSLTGGRIENNSAGDCGGGVSLYAPAGKTTSVTLGGTLIIRGNTAVKIGGGVHSNSADVGGQTLNIAGGEISGNTVTGTQPGNGGGGVAVQVTGVLNLSGGKISGNRAVVTGGGLALGGAATMTGGEISGNTVTGSAGVEGGGGVRLYSGAKMIASGGTIANNSAPFGGGLKTDGTYQTSATSEFTLAGATVSGNSTTNNVGGGFFNDGKLMVTSGSVTGNTAKTNGGGIFNSRNAQYSQTGGSVTGNQPDNVLQGQ